MLQWFKKKIISSTTVAAAESAPKKGGHIKTGRKGQELAEEYFRKQGLSIIARNLRNTHGEIDLILRDGEVIVFTEVKCRRSQRHGSGLEAITPAKKRKILAAASHYLQSQKKEQQLNKGCWPPRTRFDVLAIHLIHGEEAAYRWVKSAFEATETYSF